MKATKPCLFVISVFFIFTLTSYTTYGARKPQKNFDHLIFSLPKLKNTTWKKAYQKNNKEVGIMEYIPKNSDLKNWQQMVTIEFLSYHKQAKNTPLTQLMTQRVQNIKTFCTDLKYKRLHENKKQLFYSWQVHNCGTGILADQYEMVRIIKGEKGFNTIRYTIKTSKPNLHEHKNMLTTIMSADFTH